MCELAQQIGRTQFPKPRCHSTSQTEGPTGRGQNLHVDRRVVDLTPHNFICRLPATVFSDPAPRKCIWRSAMSTFLRACANTITTDQRAYPNQTRAFTPTARTPQCATLLEEKLRKKDNVGTIWGGPLGEDEYIYIYIHTYI